MAKDFIDTVQEVALPWLTWFFTFVGGFGGILHIIQWFNNRPRLEINQFREKFEGDHNSDSIRFEAQNIGGKPTSLKVEVILCAYTAEAERVKDTAYVSSPSRDRSLSTHQAKTFEAYFPENKQTTHTFWYLKKYTFRLSHKAKYNVYLLHSSSTPVGAFRYWVEVARCRLFGKKGLEPTVKKMNGQ